MTVSTGNDDRNRGGDRELDHCVIAVATLGEARRRFEALGFTVAPDGLHPFGTENCCVYLGNGAFLEPLAVHDEEAVAQAIADNNVFVTHDALYRSQRGEGMSGLVFGTNDARADDRSFVEEGIAAGPVLDFARRFATPDGGEDEAAFRLAFAKSAPSPDMLFFTCERVRVPEIDRSPLLSHANGATALSAIHLVSGSIEEDAATLTAMAGAEPEKSDEYLWRLPNALIRLEARTGMSTGMRAAALEFAVPDMAAVAAILTSNGVEHDRQGGAIHVPARPGQGTDFIFGEIT